MTEYRLRVPFDDKGSNMIVTGHEDAIRYIFKALKDYAERNCLELPILEVQEWRSDLWESDWLEKE